MLLEMFTIGFTMATQGVAEAADGPTVEWLQRTAQRLGAVVIGGVAVQAQGQYFQIRS